MIDPRSLAVPRGAGGDEIPRRIDMTRWTPAEHAIGAAMSEVERAGADTRLTDAVVLLGQAKDAVADYVDGVTRTPEPLCWRCKERHGVVAYSIGKGIVNRECIECASETLARMRETLNDIDAALTEGLPLLPKIMDRVEFVRECVKMQREIGAGTLAPFYPAAAVGGAG